MDYGTQVEGVPVRVMFATIGANVEATTKGVTSVGAKIPMENMYNRLLVVLLVLPSVVVSAK